jgi:hypothetical protein
VNVIDPTLSIWNGGVVNGPPNHGPVLRYVSPVKIGWPSALSPVFLSSAEIHIGVASRSYT